MKKTIRFNAETGATKTYKLIRNIFQRQIIWNYINEALDNDGLAAKYTPDQIANTRSGADPIQFPDEDYFNSTYLKDWAGYHRINGEVSGGNEIAQFFVELGWDRYNSLLKIGEGADEKTDRLSMRGNINYDITETIKLIYDGSVIFNIAKGPRYTTSCQRFLGPCIDFAPRLLPCAYPV